MLKHIYLVAFSGHRPADSPGRTNADLIAAAPRIEATLAKLKTQVEANGGELQFISSLAAGSDIIACRAALRLGMPLHIILPLPEKDFFEIGFLENEHLAVWIDPALRILAAVHPHHDGSALDLTPSHRNTLRILDSEGSENERYAKTNIEILSNAYALIAVYDGSPSHGPGSTADSVALAKSLNIPTTVINPNNLAVTHPKSKIHI